MTFTARVKEEVLASTVSDKHQLAAMMKLSGSLGLTSQGLRLTLTTEQAKIARHLYEMIEQFYAIQPDIRYHTRSNLKKNRVYQVVLETGVEAILADLQLADSFFGFETGVSSTIFTNDEAGQSYLRGAFLATGSLTDPETGKYQLEIFSIYQDHAEDLASLLQKFMLDAKVINHKNGTMTYLQKAEDIMDFLLVIGANAAKETFEEVKVYREARNDLNRANNAETANIARTITASMKTINNISKIIERVGLDSLPLDLQEIAQKRIQHPDYSIQELADSLDTPLTKSGVNHRLRRLNKFAEELH